MIIHAPAVSRDGDEVCLAARIEPEGPAPGWPETLWFRAPATWERSLVHARADAFAAALFIVAMRRGERLEVRGPVSPRLLYGLDTYQRILHVFYGAGLAPVRVEARPADVGPGPAGTRVAAAFSGGLDSFHTLWAHLPERVVVPDARVTAGLFVHGLDIPLEDTRTFAACRDAYAPLLATLGVELVPVRTNLRAFLREVDWLRVFGSSVIAVALALGGGLRRFYVPSGVPYRDQRAPDGADPRLDPWLSTDTLEVLHHGASLTKVEKAAALAGWPAPHGALRVCWEHPSAVRNCGACAKCVRTMVALDLAGSLARHTTFDRPLTRAAVRACRYPTPIERGFARQLVRAAQAAGRRELVRDLRVSIWQSLPAVRRVDARRLYWMLRAGVREWRGRRRPG